MATKKNDGTSDELAILLDRARKDPQLAAAMVADLDGVIRQANLQVNPKSETYQDLAVQLYYVRSLLGQAIDEVARRRGGPGGTTFAPAKAYGSLTATSIERLKQDIITELRNDIKDPENK